jgi:large subunit ribosomal protein L9
MQIILLERVEKLGKLGDVVTVKPGYARNFLLPQGKALRANKANMEKFEQERADREKRNADERSTSETLAKSMDNLSVNLVRAASEMGQLFGSVSSRDIANAITEAGHAVEKRQVVMDKAIKTLGLFPIRINLHSEVSVTITVNIARSLEEAETQSKLGHAIVASDNDYDDAPAAEAQAEDAPVEAEAEEADTSDAEESADVAEDTTEETAEDKA